MPNYPRDSSNRVSKSAKNPVVSRQPSLTLEQALALIYNSPENVTPTRDQHRAQGSVANRTTASSSSSLPTKSGSESESPLAALKALLAARPSNSQDTPTSSASYGGSATPNSIPAVKALHDWFLQSPIINNNIQDNNNNNNQSITSSSQQQREEQYQITRATFKQALMQTDTKSLLAVLRAFSTCPLAQIDFPLIGVFLTKFDQPGVWDNVWCHPELRGMLDNGDNGDRLRVLLRDYQRDRELGRWRS